MMPKNCGMDRLAERNRAFHDRGTGGAAYALLGEMEYEYNADIGLAYASLVRGVWNIVHIGTLVPGGHQIYVCPTSCLRGVVLTTAEMGRMDKLSTITVGEDNILEGNMEEQLLAGTERVIRELPERPRMIMIFTSCIHHFMAVNYQRIYKILRKKYPDIDFVDCYMDPIMRRTSPAVPSLWRQMHRVLEPAEPRNPKQVNLVGNCFHYSPKYCDFSAMLEKNGIRVLEANHVKDYDEFLEMGKSSRNFYYHLTAERAVKDMETRLGQPYYRMRPGYSYAEYDEDLTRVAALLGIPAPTPEELAEEKEKTEREIEKTLSVVGETPLAVDYTAVDNPLELAWFLLEHGFRVESCYQDVFTEREEIFDRLKALKPDLRIYGVYGWNIRSMERTHEGKIVAIGQKAAYFNNTPYFVNAVENAGDYGTNGMYGYRGLRRLMELIREAAETPKPMKQLVQFKGWGCDAR